MFNTTLQRIPIPSIIQEYWRHVQPAADISHEKHVQLLKLSLESVIYGFLVLPLIAVLATLLYGSKHDASLMSLWALAYFAAFFYGKALKRAFEEDSARLDNSALLSCWLPKLHLIATLQGIGQCLPLLITSLDPSYEFYVFWYLIIAGIVAINATLATAVLSIYIRFLNTVSLIACPFSILAFPAHWYYITPIFLLFSYSFYRYALIVHKFLLQQVRLEERSALLAEQFKEAKESAEIALSDKNRFLATASHDLRQPVHAMGMLIEAISQRNQDAALTPALADLRSSLRSTNLMFNSLLDLSKLESGVLKIENKPVHLPSFLQDIVKIFEHEASNRLLQLRLHLPSQAAYAFTDVNLLRQVMINLTQNALRYTQQGGVLLAVRKRKASWQIEVCDTGIGVAKEMQSDIYLPYFRQQHAWDIGSDGHGLGLAVVARCAFLLKSPLDMTSRLGRGSRFWIRVPCISTPAQSASGQHGSDFSSPPMNHDALPPIHQGSCLIVEDDPQVSRAWQALMQSWAVEVQTVSNSAEAFACLHAGFEPQAILCDERLRAGESGFELLKALMERLPHARGAMVSGEFNAPALVQAEEEGFLVLRKPVDIGLVHDLLSRWLTKK